MIEPANTIFNSASNASSQEMKFGASIRAIGVTKIFGKDQDAFHALGPIDLEIKSGSLYLFSLIGLNEFINMYLLS